MKKEYNKLYSIQSYKFKFVFILKSFNLSAYEWKNILKFNLIQKNLILF